LIQDFINFTEALRKADEFPDNVEPAARHFKETAAKDASYLTYIGVALFLCTYIYMYVWVWTAEVNAKRIRERYLQAVLRQDIAFFDNVGAGEVATRIQTDTRTFTISLAFLRCS
jgi:ATP-binding cassette, subfamily B (MDR/TAP), member 1